MLVVALPGTGRPRAQMRQCDCLFLGGRCPGASPLAAPWCGWCRSQTTSKMSLLFVVVGRVGRVAYAAYIFGAGTAPGFDAASLHNLRAAKSKISKVRGCLALSLCRKNGGGTLTALAADAPVGPAGNHVAQPRLPVGEVKPAFARWRPAPSGAVSAALCLA